MSTNNMFDFANPSGLKEVSVRPDYPCAGAIYLDTTVAADDLFKVKNAYGKALPEEIQYRELPLKMEVVTKVKDETGTEVNKRSTFSVSLDGAYLPADQGAYYHPSLQEKDKNGREASNSRTTTNLLAALGMPGGTYADAVRRLASGVRVPAAWYPGRSGLYAEARPLSEKAMAALIARSPNGIIVDDRKVPTKKGGAAQEGLQAPKEEVVE